MRRLHHDSLIILDNFNVLPKDDSFFREFAQNDFQLLVTTRCHPTQYPIMELKELDADTELPELFCRLCPSAKEDAPTTNKIIQTVHSHTLTVVLSALSLSASGMEKLPSLNDVNYLAKYGFIHNDRENRKNSRHLQ